MPSFHKVLLIDYWLDSISSGEAESADVSSQLKCVETFLLFVNRVVTFSLSLFTVSVTYFGLLRHY